MKVLVLLSIWICAVCVSAEQPGDRDDKGQTSSICKELCTAQDKCGEKDSVTCKSCRRQCRKRLNGEIEDLGLDPNTMLMIRRLMLVRATIDEEDELWSSPEISGLLNVLMNKISGADDGPYEKNVDGQMGKRETVKSVCGQLCADREKCTSNKKCGECKKDCIAKLKDADEKIDMDDDTLQALDQMALRNEGDRLWDSPHVANFMLVVRSQLKEREDEKYGDSDDKRSSLKKVCKIFCRTQNRCIVEYSDECRTCDMDCVAKLGVDEDGAGGLDDETSGMLKRLILVASTTEDETIWKTPEMIRLLLVLMTKVGSSNVPDKTYEKDEQMKEPLELEEVCDELCELQQKCAADDFECKLCKENCSSGFDSDSVKVDLDEDTRSMLHRLLLVAATTEDESIWQEPPMQRLLLVTMTKLEGAKSKAQEKEPGLSSAEMHFNIRIDWHFLLDEEVVENEDINMKQICKQLCKLKQYYKTEDEYTSCQKDCAAGMEENTEINLDEETRMMLQRLLRVAATTEDESVWKTPEMKRLLLILMVKLHEAEAAVESKDEEKVDDEDTEDTEGGVKVICEMLCKDECKFQVPQKCQSCKEECSRKLTDGEVDLFDGLDETTKFMFHRLLLVAATTKDETIWEKPAMRRLILVLMTRLDEKMTDETADIGKEYGKASEQLRQICDALCEMQTQCDGGVADECSSCKEECQKGDISKELDSLDEDTQMILRRFLLIAATTDDESIWDQPKMKKFILILMVKIQKAGEHRTKETTTAEDKDKELPTTTKPVTQDSQESYKTIYRLCKEECGGRCISASQRRNIIGSTRPQCRKCVKNECGGIYKIIKTDCAFLKMELECSAPCPPVSQDIKNRMANCYECDVSCKIRERLRQRS